MNAVAIVNVVKLKRHKTSQAGMGKLYLPVFYNIGKKSTDILFCKGNAEILQ